MLAQKLRDMHALAADSCDPEYNRALLDAADEIERLGDRIQQAMNWLRQNAGAEREPKARAALIEAHNAMLAIVEGRVTGTPLCLIAPPSIS